MVAGQLPIRLAAVDAVNSMMCSPGSASLALEAVQLLGEPVRSGNNGIRIPAINAVAHIAIASKDDRAFSAAIDLTAGAARFHGDDRRHGSADDGGGRSGEAWNVRA